MPESQQHGFAWENEIKTEVFTMNDVINYTSPHDVPKELNKFNNRENISIKTTGSGTVCMGDALRMFQYTTAELHTGIIIRYKQEGGTKKLTNVFELDLDNKLAIWGSVTLRDIQELDRLICSMPHGQRVKSIDDAIRNKKKELNAKSGLMRFNPKIDSKTQRRLQCSITNFAQSIIVKTSTSEAVVRGTTINPAIHSVRRSRNRRV